MNDPLEALQSDISFLKALALEGRAAPPLGGSILVAAGCVYGVASLLHWAIQTGKLPVSPWAYAVVWSAATVIFIAVMLVIFRRLRPMKAQSAGNRAIGLAWQGVGWTIFTLVASAFLVAWRIDSPIPTLLIPSIVLGLYGLGWSVAAAISGKGWIRLTAMGAYAGALLLAAFCTLPDLMLLYAAALGTLAIAPGLILMRQAKTAP